MQILISPVVKYCGAVCKQLCAVRKISFYLVTMLFMKLKHI